MQGDIEKKLKSLSEKDRQAVYKDVKRDMGSLLSEMPPEIKEALKDHIKNLGLPPDLM